MSNTRIRVLYATDAQIPSEKANSVNVVNFCDALAEHEHEVVLVCKSPCSSSKELEAHYGPKHCFSIVNIRLRLGIRLLNRVFFGLAVALQAVRRRSHILYSRSEYACIFGSMIGLDCVWESHAVMYMDPFSHRVILPAIARSRVKVFAITNALRNDLISAYSMCPKDVHVLPDAANPPLSDRSVTFAPGHYLEVGYVGHLYPGKAMEIVVQVASLCPWARFHIVGGTSASVSYWQSRTVGVNNIVYHGFVSQYLVSEYLNSFAVALVPVMKSIIVPGGFDIGRWTSPLKLFEYMAHAKAIVCSDIPVLREIVDHKRNGLLCDPLEPRQWCQALGQLRDNPSFRERLGRAALQDFLSSYTWLRRAEVAMGLALHHEKPTMV